MTIKKASIKKTSIKKTSAKGSTAVKVADKKTADKKTATKNARKFDVVVVGAGPAGYVAAIRCAQLGLSTACVDEWQNHDGEPSLGGTCLNVGCIPSKALLESSHLYQQANEEFAQHGISAASLQVDVAVMQSRKNKVVKELTQGIETLFKVNNVTLIHGRAKISAHDTVKIFDRETRKRKDRIKAKNIIIATGSSPVRLQQLPLDGEVIIDSAGALEMKEVPERLAIIGAGAIGLELGSVWSRLGSEVVLFEAMHDFLQMADSKMAKLVKRSLEKTGAGRRGLDIRLDTRIISAEVKDNKVRVNYEKFSSTAAVEQTETFDRVIIAVGRKPNSDRIFGEELGIERDERRFILVNKYCETSVPNIYAIGDVIRGPMLAHKGSEEGLMVAERIAGNHPELNYELIPSVIYIHPEFAWVGKTEEECAANNLNVRIGTFPIAASGRARAMAETDGQVKIIADADTDHVLGVHIFSAHASELIGQAVLMMEMQATSEDIALTMFAHPTLSESIHEAALSIHGNAIHIKNR